MPSMAIKNRKLFPALSSMNQTEDCSDLCIPGCPYNCYPYTDYYFSQPPPPPLSPPPPMIPEEHSLSPYIIVTITLLACFFLFLSYYVFVAKSYPRWCCLRRESEGQGGNNTDDEFTEGSQIDHPIWFITTIGLQQSVINSIAMFKYKKGEGLIDGSECSVCLNEFQENETLRLLPKCSHAFHVSCIDSWLRSHTNCPLCRANIVVDGPSTPLVGNAQNPDDGNVVGSTRIQDSQVAYGTSNDHQRDENGVEDVNERADVGAEGNLKEDVNVNGYGDGSETEKINMISVGRRFSMNSVKAEETVYLDPGYQTSLHIDLVDHDERGRSSISHCLRISPIPMKRSSSCSGRFFSSRHNQLLKYALQS